jgi:hypothetical protein
MTGPSQDPSTSDKLIEFFRGEFRQEEQSGFARLKRVPDSSVVKKLQCYKMDLRRGEPSVVSDEQFEYASSIRSVKAPELRKRIRAALEPLGYYKTDQLVYYLCRRGGREFRVHVDCGGRTAQLRYVVARTDFTDVHPLSQFVVEKALAFGFGDWDFIVEENVDDVFALFTELVTYCFELPDRIRASVQSTQV